MSVVNFADVIYDASYGDCGKGKVSSHLSEIGDYDFVARWGGGQNAGHTVYVDDVDSIIKQVEKNLKEWYGGRIIFGKPPKGINTIAINL